MADSNYIINQLESYGVPYADSYTLAAVGFAESSYRTNAVGDGGDSIGVFQINMPAHGPKLTKWTSSTQRSVWVNWLSNLDNNIYAAAQVYKSQGLGAWTMYKNGGYKAYLGQNLQVRVGSISSSAANVPNTAPQSNPDFESGQGFYSPYANVQIPETNQSVVPGSESFGDVLYGRRYRVIVSSLDGTKALDVSELRCTFSCVKNIMQANYSEVVIYNLSPEHENAIIQDGYRVVIEAGYEGQQYGQIFDGNILQVLREKENGTDYKLTLVAIDSDMFLNYGASYFSITRGENARSVIDHLANKATIPAELGNISQGLTDSRLTRGKVFFGLTKDYLRQLAQSQNATFYMEDGKINIIKADDLPGDEAFDLTPETGLVGVPAQQDYGATVKMLLNPKIKIGTFIHVDNSLIRNQQFQQGQPVYLLDQDGLYRAIKITHTGDTRGNDWYTIAETVKQSGLAPDLQSDPNVNPFNG